MKRLFILLITLLPFGSVVRAQDTLPRVPHYNFRLDSTTIMLGDQTVLAVEKTPLYPSMDDLTNNDIVAVRQWMDTADGTLYTALTSFEEGEHWLHIGDDSVMLTVNDMPGVDTTSAEIRDIANIMSQPYTFGEIARVVLYIWLFWAVVAGAVLLYLRIKRKKPLISLPEAPPLPPDTRALQRLEQLRQQQWWQQGKVKEYYTELTDTVRVYLEEACGIQSTEMTTDQTLDAFHASPACNSDTESLLRQTLQAADMVKFAKSQPQPYQHDLALGESTEFIKATWLLLKPETDTPDTENTAS